MSTKRNGIRKISSHYRNSTESRMQSSRVKYSLFSRASASLSRQVDSAEHFYFHGGKWWYLQAVETAVSRRFPEMLLSPFSLKKTELNVDIYSFKYHRLRNLTVSLFIFIKFNEKTNSLPALFLQPFAPSVNLTHFSYKT